MRHKDIEPFVRGLVEENSPIPIEQTSWGYFFDNRSKPDGRLFYYAGSRELVFGKGSKDPSDLGPYAVLPGVAVLRGLGFGKPTWIFLREKECLTAARFEDGSPIPVSVVSRFLPDETSEEDLFKLRESLRQKILDEDSDFVPGVIRISSIDPNGKGLGFRLEQKEAPEAKWRSWKRTEFSRPRHLHAADVREREILGEQELKQSSQRKILAVAAAILLSAMLLGLLEVLQFSRGKRAEALQALASEQQPQVERLQEIEQMTISLREVFESRFEPYRWLMVLNENRPPEIHFTSFGLDKEGSIRVNGEGPGVTLFNDYLSTLANDPRLSSVRSTGINTDEGGVTFTLAITAGDLNAELPTEEEAVTEELKAKS